MPVVMVNGEQLGDSESPKPQNDDGIDGATACEARNNNLRLCVRLRRLKPLNFVQTGSSAFRHRNYFSILGNRGDDTDTTSFWDSAREGSQAGFRQGWCEYGKNSAKRRNSSHGRGSEDCVDFHCFCRVNWLSMLGINLFLLLPHRGCQVRIHLLLANLTVPFFFLSTSISCDIFFNFLIL